MQSSDSMRLQSSACQAVPKPLISSPFSPVLQYDCDAGTEELGHLEMIGAIVHQLTRTLTEKQIEESGFAPYFVDHTAGVYPTSASGTPFTAAYIGVKGDTICDLNEDMAAEQKARVTYDNILRLVDDPDVREPIKFLREREIVHFQRFGEAKRTRGSIILSGLVQDKSLFYPHIDTNTNKIKVLRENEVTP